MNTKIILLVLISCITNVFSQNLNFINKADKLIARSGSSSAKQFGGSIYISNGFSGSSAYSSEIEKYNPTKNTWSLFTTSTPSIAKQYGNSEIAFGTTLCIFNGNTNTGINDKIEKINLATGALTLSPTLNPNPVYGAGSEYFSSSLLSFGGCSDKFNAVYSNKFYSISINPEVVTVLPDMPVGLETKGKILYGNGENLYAFGGYKETNDIAENFETLTIGTDIAVNDWLNVAETGTKLYRANAFNSNKYAQISSFSSNVANQETSNKVWLISNVPLTASASDQVYLNFDTKDGFNNGATLQPYLITNWTGNIATSTKILLFGNIAFGSTAGIAANYTNSGNILLYGDLSNFRIAFKYTGGYTPLRTTSFQIDNVRVYKTTISNNIYKYSFSDGSNAWVTLNTLLPQSLSAYAVASDGFAKAYITGDYNNQTFTGVFDGVTETFTTLTQTNMLGRRHHNSEIFNNNLYIMGGNTDSFIGSVTESTQSVDLATLSYNESASNAEFRISPNPATDLITINDEIETLSIFTIEGKKIEIQNLKNTINISHLSNGLYVVIGENKNGNTFKTKLVKK